MEVFYYGDWVSLVFFAFEEGAVETDQEEHSEMQMHFLSPAVLIATSSGSSVSYTSLPENTPTPENALTFDAETYKALLFDTTWIGTFIPVLKENSLKKYGHKLIFHWFNSLSYFNKSIYAWQLADIITDIIFTAYVKETHFFVACISATSLLFR